MALVTQDSVLIAWKTDQPAAGTVEYSTDQSFALSSSDAGVQAHAISLSGLLPDTHYFYRILVDGDLLSEGHGFNTAPANGSLPFRFAAFGDSGTGGQNQLAVAARVLLSDPRLVILTGDAIYEAGAASEINPHYFVPYANLLDHVPFYVALGNHDVSTQNGQPLLDALYLPINNVDNTERYYSFDWGNVHFAALNSNSSFDAGSPQRTWLEGDLSGSTADWKFVYFHHPPFSSSRHGSSISLRNNLEPIFDSQHVDIVFSGHDHDYERTFPLLAAQVVDAQDDPNYTNPQGPIYIVTGGGGRSLYPKGTSFFTAFSESTFHFTQVDVNGLDLTVTAIRADGTVMDQATIHKQ